MRMVRIALTCWFCLIGWMAVQTELHACYANPVGLYYPPYDMYCIPAEGCSPGLVCENGICNEMHCVGWWQWCKTPLLCGQISECIAFIRCY